MTDLKFPDSARPVYMNWRPEDACTALSIFERGGPLVDVDTGRVVILARLRPELWRQLVPELPDDAVLNGEPRDENIQPTTTFTNAAKAAWQRELVTA